MKKIILCLSLMFSLPGLSAAQYAGGNGRGDAFAESLGLPVGMQEKEMGSLPGCILKQNYPNPFSTLTTLEYTVLREERVTIALYDNTGTIVVNVLDKPMTPGRYTSIIDGTFLNSGLYCCRLSAGNHSQTKLMILLK